MLIRGDARHIPLRDETVQCCVTSPPYWGLRDYGTPGQIGLERTVQEYVETMRAVGREIWRVLRPDGTFWLNLGDSYATGAGKVGECPGGGEQGSKWAGRHPGRMKQNGLDTRAGAALGPMTQPNRMPQPGLKPKDLCMIPARVALALQGDGWWLRSDIVWSKPSCMPESITDRPTKSHEYIFMLTKAERYFWDQEAVKEAAAYYSPNAPDKIKSPYGQGFTRNAIIGENRKALRSNIESRHRSQIEGGQSLQAYPNGKRNIRSVWIIATQPYSGSHFATFPREIPERCIKAGTSERGCCPKCGAPWERVVDRNQKVRVREGSNTSGARSAEAGHGKHGSSSTIVTGEKVVPITIGWQPSCSCNAGDPVPCIVLDPFCGSGTSVLVARDLGRIGIGLDLTYQDLAAERLGGPLFKDVVNSAWSTP